MGMLGKDLEENMEQLNRLLQVDKNFDLIFRRLEIGGKKACIYFIDGFVQDGVLQRVIQFFYGLKAQDMPKSPDGFLEKYIPYGEVGTARDIETMMTQLLSGVSCLLIDGYEEALTIDCRTYPARSVDEPDKEKVMRGSKDGFVETLVFNTALIRRRIRDPQLVIEAVQVGKTSKTDIAICYMNGRVDESLLSEIKNRLSRIDVDALTMNQESLAECLYQRKWFNPFPKYRFSERPDTAAAHILEGNITILVDNSPSAMILPSSIFDIIEDADDYYFPPVTGTYLRLSRALISLAALFLTPLWLLLMQNQQWIPEWLDFIRVQEEIHVPIIAQLLILELAIDGLRLASLNTPNTLSTTLSVMAALVLGEFSVKSGWFNAETMLYMAFVALSNQTQASFELGYALKFMRIIMLLLTYFFNGPGFAAGVVLTVCAVAFNKTISGKSYLYPLLPFHWKEVKQRFFRTRIPHQQKEK